MSQSMLRLTAFLAGLFILLSWELTVPHHPPTASRLRRWFSNLSLAAINGGVVALVCAACFGMAAARAVPWRFGLFETAGLPFWGRLAGEILVLDLVVYFFHRAYHRFPVLWRFHQVHHSDLDLDVSSASRFHFGEVTVSSAGKLGVVAALGVSPVGLVTFETVMLLAAQFQHANVRLPAAVDRVLWWTFVPPSMHRIHHNPERAATDSNFGTIVTLWDRLFSTLRRRPGPPPSFGLPELRDERGLVLTRLVLLPFRRRSG
jgi:sterol desaturase/sphingolipid hydroxylase (fatty acid hydroxylase superfamily)